MSGQTSSIADYAAWQAANEAAYCQRMCATITPATCLTNMYKSNGKDADCRCHGCGGLDNQPQPVRPLYVLDCEENSTPVPETPSGSASTAAESDAFTALDEVIDGLYENPLPGDDFDDVEIDLVDDELLALFPELAKDPWPEYPRFSEYQTEAPRHAVYRGRCIKCGGYVDNIRERQDDNVFRCLACGWRTSPEYERNRAIHSAGGEI